MKKSELIKALEKYPDDTMVVVSGYEDGYDNPIISEGLILINDNTDLLGNKEVDYYGVHSLYTGGSEKSTFAILISRHKVH